MSWMDERDYVEEAENAELLHDPDPGTERINRLAFIDGLSDDDRHMFQAAMLGALVDDVSDEQWQQAMAIASQVARVRVR